MEESTPGMLDQSITPAKVMTEEDSFKGHNTTLNPQGNNKALSGRQPQGAEAPGASEEDTGISPGRFIAYSTVRKKVTL